MLFENKPGQVRKKRGVDDWPFHLTTTAKGRKNYHAPFVYFKVEETLTSFMERGGGGGRKVVPTWNSNRV